MAVVRRSITLTRSWPVLAACLWTTYRQCQLHLIDLQTRIGLQLNLNALSNYEGKKFQKLSRESLKLVEDTCASIPFMLIGDNLSQRKPSSGSSLWIQQHQPAVLGGLHLQWILFTISVLSTIPQHIQSQMKIILIWIGKNLGIGQATVLGLVS